MSRFNKFGVRIDQSARDAFKSTRELSTHSETQKNRKQHGDALAVAKAEAAYREAQAALAAVKQEMENRSREFAALREQLVAELGKEYGADPADIDTKTLELLKSGIMDSGEYARIFNSAVRDGNYTMARMIGKYANEAAEARENNILYGSDAEARALKEVYYSSQQYDGRDQLANFDTLVYAFNRCITNPFMIDSWDALTADIINAM